MPGKTKSKYTLGAKGDVELYDLELPSGATCQAKRPGVQGLIAAGIIDSFDELTALVQTEHVEPNTARSATVTPAQAQSAGEAMLKDPAKLNTALQLMDRMTALVITQPLVWVDYQMERCVLINGVLMDEADEDWEARRAKAKEDGALAARVIDMEDKLFLLNWAVGGPPDLSKFREGSKELLGNLAAG